MSLINKMLQELDRRGSPVQGSIPAAVVLPVRERNMKPRGILIVVLVMGMLLAIVLALGWRFLPSSVRQLGAGAPLVMLPTVPVALPVPVPAPAPIAAPEVVLAAAEPAVKMAPKRVLKPHAGLDANDTAPSAKSRVIPVGTSMAVATQGSTQGADLSPKQRAENAYRRALAALQEGRVTEAMNGLQQAIVIDPHHEASRQTLIRLLLESNRPEEAMRQLEQALTLDPAQPGMAMMLARMQLDKNGPALDTLTRTLPFALSNSEYHAFFAGVLQRQQRFKEAGEHYELALRSAPQNGVWLMGLGIALQAQQRLLEAKEAFSRAKNSASLTPELQIFVDRKLQQLTH